MERSNPRKTRHTSEFVLEYSKRQSIHSAVHWTRVVFLLWSWSSSHRGIVLIPLYIFVVPYLNDSITLALLCSTLIVFWCCWCSGPSHCPETKQMLFSPSLTLSYVVSSAFTTNRAWDRCSYLFHSPFSRLVWSFSHFFAFISSCGWSWTLEHLYWIVYPMICLDLFLYCVFILAWNDVEYHFECWSMYTRFADPSVVPYVWFCS